MKSALTKAEGLSRLWSLRAAGVVEVEKNANLDVIRSLTEADEEMQAALDAFRRAGRMRWVEIFRPANTDPEFHGGEEVHVGYGMTALLNAERHVAAATARLDHIPAENPTRPRLERSVRRLDDTFQTMLGDLRTKPSPRRIVSHLKRARRAIPQSVVRQYSLDKG